MRLRAVAALSGLVIALGLSGVALADATSVNLTPETQNVAAGERGEYWGTWQGTAPFDIQMCWGDGSPCWRNHEDTSSAHFWTHAFLPSCDWETYQQSLRADQVIDYAITHQAPSYCLAEG